jgi:opine dehydrogenase
MNDKNDDSLKFAILGAGHGGHAMAADLTLRGHVVNLYNKWQEPFDAIQELGGIQITGDVELEGLAVLNKITTNMEEAIEEDVDVIMVTVPSFAHKFMIDESIPYLRDGQVIIFNPGNFVTLEFAKELKERGIKKDILIAETECLIYATRLIEPAKSQVVMTKGEVLLSALPAKDTDSVLKIINKAYPQFVGASNVFDTSINNVNFVVHPTVVILNASRIEQKGPYECMVYDASPAVGKVMEAVDREKMLVADALGLDSLPAKEIFRRYYDAKGNTLFETLQEAYKTPMQSADTLKYRYVSEDVPYGLVPLASLGKSLGVSTPVIRGIIEISSAMNDTDYWLEGRTVEKMGLTGLNSEEIIKLVMG